MLALALALGLAALGWWWIAGGGEENEQTAETVATAYLRAWQRSDWQAMEALVAEPPTAFREAHVQLVEALQVEEARFALGAVSGAGEAARADFGVHLRLAGLGEWSYQGVLSLRRRDGKWLVNWSLRTIHPALGGGERFRRTRSWPERAPILAYDGAVLVKPREVIAVGVEPRRIKNRKRMLKALERLVGADPKQVAADLDRPGVQPDWFVPVVELRPERYKKVRPKLYPVPGVVFRRAKARLSPAEGFAQHVLGRVGEGTAELLDELGRPYQPGDTVGLFGLERVFERRLAGRPSGEVQLIDSDGKVVEVLHRFQGKRPRPIRTTLDLAVQAAAEEALRGVSKPAALVALDVRSGALRAVASRPYEEFNRALGGLYPPGSAFKIVTTAALLEQGLAREEPASCPEEVVIGGKPFRNAEGTPLGSLSFRAAFAHSCNTAFVQLAAKLDERALTDAAKAFGFGVRYELPLPVAGGRFPAPSDLAERAAAAIGQGRVEASPLHMATVAAAVAGGMWRPPQLLARKKPTPGRALDRAVAKTLRELMRLVVLEGTGQAAEVPGIRVAGKTGTAEFGDKNPPSTHAWFVGFWNEVAFAVLVEGGGTGGAVAAPVAARFIRALVR